jgi:HEAT repeat protein
MNLTTWIANLNHPEETERMYAAEDIGYSNDPEGILPLVSRLRIEQSRAVKETIVSALTRIDHEEVMVQAVGLFNSEDACLRNQATVLLAQRGKDALSHLLRTMASPDANVRKLALDVIGQIRAPETRGILEAALKDTDLNIVITSVEHIGASQCRELKGRVEELLAGATEPMLITALLETLCEIGDETSLRLALRRFVPIEEVSEFLQYSLIKLLGELGDLEHGNVLFSLLKARGPRIYHQILDAFTKIRERHPTAALPASQQRALEKHLDQDLNDLQRYQTLMLLRNCYLEPKTQPVWRAAIRCLKNPELRQSLETLDCPLR